MITILIPGHLCCEYIENSITELPIDQDENYKGFQRIKKAVKSVLYESSVENPKSEFGAREV